MKNGWKNSRLRRMKILTVLLCLLAAAGSYAKGRRIYITPGNDHGRYIDGRSVTYAPGDTLVLTTGNAPYTYFALENVHGRPGKELVIVNEGGQVQLVNGFAFAHCSFIRLSGTGSKDRLGFRISDPSWNGVAIDIHGRSSDIEIDHVDIYNKTYGFWVKQEASCADSLQYPNWVIHDIRIHDNRIVRMGQEGMYLGSTSPNGTRAIICNGRSVTPVPLRLGNISVYNNEVDSCWRSGIQLSGADSGVNEIYHNHVTHTGFELNNNQGNGISLGGFSHAHIYNNQISSTYALGILCLGSGLTVIENNAIDSSGYLAGHTVKGMAAIMIDTRPTRPVDSSRLIIKNNRLGLNTDYGIRLYKSVDTYKKGNIISGNKGTVHAEPGIHWQSGDDDRAAAPPATFINSRPVWYAGAAIGLTALYWLWKNNNRHRAV